METIEGGATAFHLHAQDRAFPGGEQKLGEIVRREVGGELARRLCFGDAGRERRAPFGEDRRDCLLYTSDAADE